MMIITNVHRFTGSLRYMSVSSAKENGVIAINVRGTFVEFEVLLENGKCDRGTKALEK
jgi:hypothetical protein